MLIYYFLKKASVFYCSKIHETPSEYPIMNKVQNKSIWQTSEAKIRMANYGIIDDKTKV